MATPLTWLRDFRDLLSPRYCAVCGERLGSTERELCAACLMGLPYLPTDDFRDNEVSRLFYGKIPVEKAHSYIRYRNDGPSHHLLFQLKYYHRPGLGVVLGQMMARELFPLGFFQGVDSIIAVPLHWQRHYTRGYNQSLELARGVSEVTGLPLLRRRVVRIRNNQSQTHLSPSQRLENVEDIFSLRRPIPYSHVLLVDDVLTTGATLSACAHAIASVYPKCVFSILTLARAS